MQSKTLLKTGLISKGGFVYRAPKADDKQAIHSKADIAIDGKLYDLDALPKIGYGCIKLLGTVIASLHSKWLNIAVI